MTNTFITQFIIFVNVNKLLVHSALIFTNTTCDLNNALVNAEINMN